jgi:hypothetical protein
VAELDLGEGSTTAGIVDDLLDNTTGVSVGLSIVEGTELGRGLVETGVGRCKKKKKIDISTAFSFAICVWFPSDPGSPVCSSSSLLECAASKFRVGMDFRSHSLKMEPRPFLWLRMTRPMATVC